MDFSGLESDSFIRLRDLFSEEENLALFQCLKAQTLKASTLGKERTLKTSSRGDSISWLSPENAPRFLFDRMEEVRSLLNHSFYLNLKSIEMHFSHYPAGTHYERHIDTFRNDNTRVLSFVHYLNNHWEEKDRGELILYLETEIRILPRWGESVFFLSHVPHEVLTTLNDRFSLTGWVRR